MQHLLSCLELLCVGCAIGAASLRLWPLAYRLLGLAIGCAIVLTIISYSPRQQRIE